MLLIVALLALYAKSKFDTYNRRLHEARAAADINFSKWQQAVIAYDDAIGQLDALGVNLPPSLAPVAVPSQAPFPKEGQVPTISIIPGTNPVVIEPSPTQPPGTSPPPRGTTPPSSPPTTRPSPPTTCVLTVIGVALVCK